MTNTMHDFLRKFITEWRQIGPGGSAKIVLAVSGGADSTAMLAAFAELRKRKKIENPCVVAHFDHGLRGEASIRDSDFCNELAKRWSIQFTTGTAKEPYIGNLEQAARESRYNFLLETAENVGANCVLTGHTVDDQAETFMLNLLRGSGLDGLAAMPVTRELAQYGKVDLIRPLLRWARRSETQEFCDQIGIDYRNDEMNQDKAFKRVRIRKEILPMLSELNPKVIQTLANTSQTMLSAAASLEYLVNQNDSFRKIISGERMVLSQLLELPEYLQLTIVREWIKQKRTDLRGIGMVNLRAVVDVAKSRKSGKTVEMPGGDLIVKDNGALQYQSRSLKNERSETTIND